MKRTKLQHHEQRRAIDRKLKELAPLKEAIPPRMGWVKAVRESLGLTTRQLAERLKIAQTGVAKLEAREVHKQVTLEMLERVAQGMDCRVYYAIVPVKSSLEEILEARSIKAAERILRSIKHSMKLEDQSVNKDENLHQLKALAKELKESLDPCLWEED